MPTILISSLSQVIGSQYSIAAGKEKNLMIAVIVGAFTNVIFNSLLIPRYSYNGAAIGTVIAELTQFIIQILLAKKMVYRVFSLKKLGECFIAAVGSLFVMLMIKQFLAFSSAFLGLAVCSMIFFSIFFVFLAIAKYDMCMEIIDFVVGKLRKERHV